MASVAAIVRQMRTNPRGVRFADLVKGCDHHLRLARRAGGSHRVYRTPWPGNPRVNIQNDSGAAKAYQVRQVLRAIDTLDAGDE